MLSNLIEILRIGFESMGWQNYVMIVVGGVLVFLGIRYKMEPLLLVPIGFSAILANFPAASQITEFMHLIYVYLIRTEVIPILIFLGLGAMTDFEPLLADPKTFLLGAAAQIGVYVAMGLALVLGFGLHEAAVIGIIGGADGPTTIYLSTQLAPEILAAVTVAAYSYMSLVPIIQPPIIRAMVPKRMRRVEMKPLRKVSRREKLLFPVAATIVTGLLVPYALPLIGMLMFGNILRESGVTERLAKAASNEIINIATVLLGLGIGAMMTGDAFLRLETLKILGLGVVAFASATAGGVLLGMAMYYITRGKVNPLIGAAGVSAVPMSARVVNREGLRENPRNFLLMHAMGPNVAGVIGTAVAAGIFIALLAP